MKTLRVKYCRDCGVRLKLRRIETTKYRSREKVVRYEGTHPKSIYAKGVVRKSCIYFYTFSPKDIEMGVDRRR